MCLFMIFLVGGMNIIIISESSCCMENNPVYMIGTKDDCFEMGNELNPSHVSLEYGHFVNRFEGLFFQIVIVHIL